jgi:hypothetical protein
MRTNSAARPSCTRSREPRGAGVIGAVPPDPLHEGVLAEGLGCVAAEHPGGEMPYGPAVGIHDGHGRVARFAYREVDLKYHVEETIPLR